MKPLIFLLAMSLSLSVFASPPSFTPAASNDRGRSANVSANSDQRSAPKSRQQNEDISADYQPIIRRVLEEYFGLSSSEATQTFEQKRIPPGLQKKLARGDDLPPGWQMKLVRGDIFPPDLYAESTRLPNHWAGHGGHTQEEEWLLLEDQIIRIAQGQGTILDIIDITQTILR